MTSPDFSRHVEKLKPDSPSNWRERYSTRSALRYGEEFSRSREKLDD